MPPKAAPVREGRTFIEAARREQIVAAAVTTLAELGYADTSLGKIAKTAGLSSVGMISYYFADKAELMSEVVASVLAAADELVAPRIAAGTTAVERFHTYVTASLEYVAWHRSQAVALIEITVANRGARGPVDVEARASEVVADLVARAQDERAQHERAQHERAQEDRAGVTPAPDPVDPHLVAVAVRGAINNAVGRSLRRLPGPGPDPELVAEGVRLAAMFDRVL